jgi:acetyl-CoA carboxylase carboxyltransferase component
MSILDERTLGPSPTRRAALEEWRALRAEVLTPQDPAAVERHLTRGKLLARERIEMLLDPGSFQELMMMDHTAAVPQLRGREAYGDGIVAGWGTIDGRRAFVFSQDATVVGGSLGSVGGAKVARIIDLAIDAGAPVVGILDGGGARIQEGVSSLNAFGGIFFRNTRASGVVPQISLIMGVATGGAVYSPALTDFVFMVESTAQLAITGPKVIKEVTGEEVTLEELGGAAVHGGRTGVVHFVVPDERSCLDGARRLLGYLPRSSRERPPIQAPVPPRTRRHGDPLDTLPPGRPGNGSTDGNGNGPSHGNGGSSGDNNDDGDGYDVRALLTAIVDGGEILEYATGWARNVVCAFTRIGGLPLGVVANQPQAGDGRLDIDGCEKAARFIRTCDAFNLPILTLVDCPGLADAGPDRQGPAIRAAAKLVHARAEALVPRISLLTGRADPDAFLTMGAARGLSDLRLAWPTAELGATGSTLYDAARHGIVDRVIEPHETRGALLEALTLLAPMERGPYPRKHENIPL